MMLTELQVPDLKTMAEGRKAAETARELKELKELKKKVFFLRSALRTVVEDRNAALDEMILYRRVAAVECIAIVAFYALWLVIA